MTKAALKSAKKTKARRLLRKKEVLARVPLSYPALWKRMTEGKFPRSHDMGNGTPGWFEDEVDAWMQSLPVIRLKGDEGAAA
jgi:prophage regulatory protein